MKRRHVLQLAKNIKKEMDKGIENYNTGLLGEQMIVASYKTMELDKLEKLRFILNKIIKQKKLSKVYIENNNTVNTPIDNKRINI